MKWLLAALTALCFIQPALPSPAAPLAEDPASLHQPWSQQLLQTLYDIEQEPAIYLMVKRRP